MANLRDLYIDALCKFTHLHSPSTMRFKNALAFKFLLRVAETVGDHLQDRWAGQIVHMYTHTCTGAHAHAQT